jgi:nicotinamidase-related amidase
MDPQYIDGYTRSVELTPASTALLIVDMQNASGSRSHGLGRMLAAEGRLDEAAYRFDRIDNLLIPNIRRLADTFRACGAHVIHVTYGSNCSDFADAPLHLRKWLIATNNCAGTPEHEIVEALRPLPGELVLNKTTMGAFGSTGIDMHLRGMGVTELVVVGVSTNNCVGMTAMEASDRQYGVAIVSDATGTCSDEMQEAFLRTWRRLWGRIASTDEVIAELRSRAPHSADRR